MRTAAWALLLSAALAPAAEPWADPKLTVTGGLELWLDATRLAGDKAQPKAGTPLGVNALHDWPLTGYLLTVAGENMRSEVVQRVKSKDCFRRECAWVREGRARARPQARRGARAPAVLQNPQTRNGRFLIDGR